MHKLDFRVVKALAIAAEPAGGRPRFKLSANISLFLQHNFIIMLWGIQIGLESGGGEFCLVVLSLLRRPAKHSSHLGGWRVNSQEESLLVTSIE